MKAICSFCGHANPASGTYCVLCGQELANARRTSIAGKLILLWTPPLLCAAFLAGAYWNLENKVQIAGDLTKTKSAHTDTIAKLDADFGRKEAEMEALHRAALKDTGLLSGEQAAKRRAAEWKRRQNHDPAYAASVLEQTLVEVEKLGKDPALTAETALKRVAELVAPFGSRVEVTPAGERFVVRIAFRMSAIHPNEAGSGSRHTSAADFRSEVEEVTTRLMRDLFDYCGSRGIERLSVSCNRALTEGDADGKSRLVMRSLYRASIDAEAAARVARWRSLSIAQVRELMKVEHDILGKISIRTATADVVPLDPNEPLEF